jgi:hypothetical protein
MTTDYEIETLKQRWGEQRARNSGWTGEQFDVLDASDPRFASFGIARVVGLLENKPSPFGSPCILPIVKRDQKHLTKNIVKDQTNLNFHIPEEFWNHMLNQINHRKSVTAKFRKAVRMQIYKFTALQFGLRMDPRWLINPRTTEHFFHGVNKRSLGNPHMSMQCSTDHVCRNSRCLNPGHLQLVPIAENDLRSGIPVLNDVIECFDKNCNFNVLATWPFGFNLCQACGGDAPILHRSMRQMEMELS